MDPDCDVAIIGGGPAGACAASMLARHGVRTLLVEALRKPFRKAGETLAPKSAHALQALNLWTAFAGSGSLPSHGNVSAWGHHFWRESDFLAQGLGHAWQVDRARFEELLISAATQAGALVLRGHPLVDITRRKNHWRTNVGDRTFRSKWVIDATGRRSLVARRLGVERRMLDRLVAIHTFAFSESGADYDSRTFIESCPEGWWYSVLLPGGMRTVSLQTDANLLPGQEWRRREWLAHRLAQTRNLFPLLRSHRYVLNGSPRLTSARSGRLARFSGDGWLAIGDAAISLDPLSGHGIAQAMQSGIKAAEAIGSGASHPAAAVDCWHEELWTQFSNDWKGYYSIERRWLNSPFWRERMENGEG